MLFSWSFISSTNFVCSKEIGRWRCVWRTRRPDRKFTGEPQVDSELSHEALGLRLWNFTRYQQTERAAKTFTDLQPDHHSTAVGEHHVRIINRPNSLNCNDWFYPFWMNGRSEVLPQLWMDVWHLPLIVVGKRLSNLCLQGNACIVFLFSTVTCILCRLLMSVFPLF